MDKMDVTIGISADASGVEAGVQRSKRSLASLGDSAKRVSQDVGGMGDGSDKAAKKIERDTRSMNTSIQRQIAVMQAGSKSSREYWESLANQRGINTNALKPILDQLEQAGRKAEDAKQATIGFGDAMRFVQAAAAGGALLSIASQYMQLADAATNVSSRLKLVTSSSQELATTQASLFAIAQRARVSYTDLVDTYAQMARSTKELGVSQRDMLTVTETISKAVTISGASAASAQAALVQLSQGFASGTLRGEELNSVLEQTPRLAMAIANGMGVGIGKLRELGQAGELTAEKVVQALQNSAVDVAREFEQMATTVDQASTQAGNSLVRLIGVIDQTTGASSAAASGISRFARGFDILADSIEGVSASKSLSDWFTAAFQSGENLNSELKLSEEQMAKLSARLAKAPDNIYVRSQIVDLREYIKGLKEAQARLASLTGASVSTDVIDPRDQSQYTSRGQSYANYAKQQEAARQGLLDISSRANGVTKQFTVDLRTYEEALRAGVITTEDYVKAVTELNKKRYESTEAGKAEAKSAKDSAKGIKAADNAIVSYIKSLEARTAAQRLEIAQGEKLTESQRAQIQLAQLLADAKNKVSKSEIARAQALIKENEALEAWGKNQAEVAKALTDMQKAREQSLSSVQDSVRKLVEEAEAAAFAEANNVSLAEAIERLALARAENAYQQAVERQEAPATLAALEAELRARKQILELTAQKGVREANKKAADDAGKAWDKVIDGVGDGFYTAIVEDGASALQALQRAAEGTVLRPMVQYAANNVAGAMGLGSEGSASSLSTAASMVKNGHSVYGALTGSLTYGLGSAIAGMGTALGASAATSFGAGMAASGFTTGAFSTGVSMVGAGATSTGLGMMAGAAMPWVAGALALYSIAKSFDDSGTLHYGAGAVYSGGKLQTGADIYNRDTFGMGSRGEWNANAQQNASGIAASLGAALDGFAIGFGQKAGYTVATAFADDSSDDGAWGSLRIADALGNALVDWENSRTSKWAPKEFASGDEGYQQYLAAVAVDVKSAFLAMDIPAWGKQLLGAATDLDSLSAALAQVGAVKTVFDSLSKSLSIFADLSGDAQTTLLNTSGGIDALAQNAGSFYQGFYTEQERYENSLKQMQEVLAGLNVSIDPAMGDRAKAGFRAAVSAAFDAGQFELGAQLLGINQQFAAVADYAQKAGGAIGEVADVLSDVMRDLLDERKSLEAELLRAQGDQSGYLAAVRAIATDGYAEAEIAAWDYNTALQAQIDALDAAASAAQQAAAAEAQRVAAVAQERYGIEGQILQLQGDTAAMRERELAALDESNRALQQRIYALQDEQSVAAQAAAAKQAAESSAISNLQAAITREKGYWQEIASASQAAVSGLSSTLSLLTSNAKALYGTVDATQQWQAAQGMVYIESALAAVRGGADATGFAGLSDAISAARGGVESGNYASALDRQLDIASLAGQLSELGELTDSQLTTEERALKAAQAQLDRLDDIKRVYLDGVDRQVDGLLSVEDAVLQLVDLQSAANAASAAAAQAAAAALAAASGGSAFVSSPVNEYGSHTGIGDSGYVLSGNTLYFPGGGSHTIDDKDAARILMETYGLTAGGPNGTLIRSRAIGGYTPPGLTLVGEKGPELVNFKAPGMVYTAAQSANLAGGNTARLERLVEGLTAEVQRLNAQVETLKSDGRRSREVLEGAARGELSISTETA